jgi:hypothetical protein
MPFDEYLGIKCLNASGIKLLNISESDFWYRSWMNPKSKYIDEDSKAKMEGRAYHCRILEGEDAFHTRYALEYDDTADDPMILRGNKEMIDALTRLGIKGISSKSAESLSKLCAQYLPQYKTLHTLKSAHLEAAQGREMIHPQKLYEIEMGELMIKNHPDIKGYFRGGYPEVTVIFEAFGVRFKIRFDYLKVWDASDLKTFANVMGAEIKLAVNKAFSNQKYHIQGTLYLCGVEIAKRYAAQGLVYGFDKVEPDESRREKWLDMFSKNECNELKYAFVQKGDVPTTIPRIFSKKEKMFAQGFEVIQNGITRFKNAYERHGESVWITTIREEYLHYDDMPPWINDV